VAWVSRSRTKRGLQSRVSAQNSNGRHWNMVKQTNIEEERLVWGREYFPETQTSAQKEGPLGRKEKWEICKSDDYPSRNDPRAGCQIAKPRIGGANSVKPKNRACKTQGVFGRSSGKKPDPEPIKFAKRQVAKTQVKRKTNHNGESKNQER